MHSYIILPFLGFSFRVYLQCTLDKFLELLGLQVIREGIPLLVSIVPLCAVTYGGARIILFAFFHRDVYCSLFCDHGLDLRKMGM